MTDPAKPLAFASAENAISANSTTALALADSIIDFALERIDDAIHDYGGIEAVKAEALKLYDRLIVPVDVPYVPASVESMLDMLAKQAISQALDAGHAAIHKAG